MMGEARETLALGETGFSKLGEYVGLIRLSGLGTRETGRHGGSELPVEETGFEEVLVAPQLGGGGRDEARVRELVFAWADWIDNEPSTTSTVTGQSPVRDENYVASVVVSERAMNAARRGSPRAAGVSAGRLAWLQASDEDLDRE